MQQPTMAPSFSPPNITSDQIQKYLDENKKLILAILDNQNLGKLAECAQYQAQLQKNLMYLAAIADAQPQLAAMPAQMNPHPAMQQGAYYMQQQATAMGQQPGVFSPRMPTQFANPMQFQEYQQAILTQVNMMRPTGPSSNIGSTGAAPTLASASEKSGGSKQDVAETSTGADGQVISAGGDGDASYLKSQKGSDEGK